MTKKKTTTKKQAPKKRKSKAIDREAELYATWAAAAAAADIATLLAYPTADPDELPESAAEKGAARRQIETVAAMVGIVDPEDMDRDDLEAQVEEVLDEEISKSSAALVYFREAGVVSAPSGAFAEVAETLWADLGEVIDPASWSDGELLRLNPYAWAPITDPTATHFDVRIELPLDEKTRESVAKQGIIVPGLVTVGPEGELVVLDGIQRWRAALDVNRERLARWARLGQPQELITSIPVKVVRKHTYAALGAANEVRQSQDRMTRALRLHALTTHGELDLDEAAQSLGMGRRMATYYLSLLKLSPRLQRKLRTGGLSFALARVVCQLDGEELQHAAVSAVATMPSASAIASLRAALADDALAAAIRDGAKVAKPEEAGPGMITACAVTGAWFLVTETSAATETPDGDRYVAPGAEGADPPPLKGAAAVRAAVRSGKGGTPRDRRVAENVLAALEGREVEAEMAWLLGLHATAGKRRPPKKPKGRAKADRLDSAIVALLDEEGPASRATIAEVVDATDDEIAEALRRLTTAGRIRATPINGEASYSVASSAPRQTDLEARIAEVSR